MAFIKLPTYGMLLLCQIASFPRHTSEFYKLLQQEHLILLWLTNGKFWRVTADYLSWLGANQTCGFEPCTGRSLKGWHLGVTFGGALQLRIFCESVLLRNLLETENQAKKFPFFIFALIGRTEAQIQQNPFADCLYHIHIIKLSWMRYACGQSFTKGEASSDSGLQRSNPLASPVHHPSALNLLHINLLWSIVSVSYRRSIHSLVQVITSHK